MESRQQKISIDSIEKCKVLDCVNYRPLYELSCPHATLGTDGIFPDPIWCNKGDHIFEHSLSTDWGVPEHGFIAYDAESGIRLAILHSHMPNEEQKIAWQEQEASSIMREEISQLRLITTIPQALVLKYVQRHHALPLYEDHAQRDCLDEIWSSIPEELAKPLALAPSGFINAAKTMLALLWGPVSILSGKYSLRKE